MSIARASESDNAGGAVRKSLSRRAQFPDAAMASASRLGFLLLFVLALRALSATRAAV